MTLFCTAPKTPSPLIEHRLINTRVELTSLLGRLEITRYQLQDFNRQCESAVDSLDDSISTNEYQKKVNYHYSQNQANKNELINLFEQSLLRQKEQFQAVFRTTYGSLYFVLSSGESFRIKSSSLAQSPEERLQQPFESIVFVNQQTQEHLLQTWKTETNPSKIFKNSVPIQEFQEGVFPVELGTRVIHKNSYPASSANVIFPNNTIERWFHIGHRITEIL